MSEPTIPELVAFMRRWARIEGFSDLALRFEATANALERVAVLEAALERIVGMCDVPGRCTCGRPNGIPAVVACAKDALSAGVQEPSHTQEETT